MVGECFAGEAHHPQLARAITNARSARLKGDFAYIEHLDPLDPRVHREFHGECHCNVLYLCEALAADGFTPYIRWGALVQSRKTPPTTIDEVETDGYCHFWAEVQVDGETYNLDLASEIPGDPGRPLLATTLPESYHRPESSLLSWQMDISAKDLRNLEGYNHLVERGLLA